MARVRVRMFATVREAARQAEWSVDARDLRDLLDKLGRKFGEEFDSVLKDFSEDPDRLVILVNGKHTRTDRGAGEFSEGDEVAIFPPVSGG